MTKDCWAKEEGLAVSKYMGTTVSNYAGTTVFSIPERKDFYCSALGDEIDFRGENSDEISFAIDLNNLLNEAGKQLLIIDVGHFANSSVFTKGLKHLVDNVRYSPKKVRVIIIVPKASPNKRLIHFVTQYCMIFDVICGVPKPSMVNSLKKILERPNSRKDVAYLMTDFSVSEKSKEELEYSEFIEPVRVGQGYIDIRNVKNTLENPSLDTDIEAYNEGFLIQVKLTQARRDK